MLCQANYLPTFKTSKTSELVLVQGGHLWYQNEQYQVISRNIRNFSNVEPNRCYKICHVSGTRKSNMAYANTGQYLNPVFMHLYHAFIYIKEST